MTPATAAYGMPWEGAAFGRAEELREPSPLPRPPPQDSRKSALGLRDGDPASCLESLSQHWHLSFPSSSFWTLHPLPHQGPQRPPQLLEQGSQIRASGAPAGAASPALSEPHAGGGIRALTPGDILGKCCASKLLYNITYIHTYTYLVGKC